MSIPRFRQWPPLTRAVSLVAVLAAVVAVVAGQLGAFAAPVADNGCAGGHLVVDLAPDGTYTSSCTQVPTPTGTPSASATTSSPAPTTPAATTAAPSTPPATTPPAPTTPAATTVPPSPSSTPTPTPTSSLPQPGSCPVAGKNAAGAADPWGGCWPGPGTTGFPDGLVTTMYTGPCTITTANLLIDLKTIVCTTLDIRAPNVVITRSLLFGVDVTDEHSTTASFAISHSTVVNNARDQCACIGYHDFTADHVEVRGGNRSMYCEARCTVTDSWMHGQQLLGAQHASGLREEQYTTARHNTIVCDWPAPDPKTTLGCSGGLTGYADFAPIHNNTIDRNLFLGSITESYCAYGGASGPKPYSSDPTNATYQVFTDNVFQYGLPGDKGLPHCGYYAPVGDFAVGRVGNVFTGNQWEDGKPVTTAQIG